MAGKAYLAAKRKAHEKIARDRGETLRCMVDITPEATVYGVPLSDFHCAGPVESLTIDHINGAQRGEDRKHLIWHVNNGSRGTSDLRLLCVVHNSLYRPRGWEGV